MKYREYDTLPFKIFYKLLSDETNLSPLGYSDEIKSRKVWSSIKEEWKRKHPSAKEKTLTAAQIKVLKEVIEMNRTVAFLRFALNYSGDQEKLYKELGFKWIEDETVRIETCLNTIEKAKVKKGIFENRLIKLREDLEKEDRRKETQSLADINKSIASLELNGFTIQNYEELTCGKIRCHDGSNQSKTKKCLTV